MAEDKFDLIDGLKVGGVAQKDCVIREALAGDVIAASEESEKPVSVTVAFDEKGKPIQDVQLVTSPTMVGINTLRRQIVRIGEQTGPFEMAQINMLSVPDLNLIQNKANILETASLAVAQKGRTDSPREGDAETD